MPKFEDLLNMAKDGMSAAEKKANELWDTTKLKMEISRLEKEISSTYEGLGRLVYDAKTGSDEDTTELLDTCVQHIRELTEQAEKLQEKLAESKHAVRCKECGKMNEGDASFCKFCGKAL